MGRPGAGIRTGCFCQKVLCLCLDKGVGEETEQTEVQLVKKPGQVNPHVGHLRMQAVDDAQGWQSCCGEPGSWRTGRS